MRVVGGAQVGLGGAYRVYGVGVILAGMANRITEQRKVSRRGLLKKATAGAAAVVSLSVAKARREEAAVAKKPFVLCLNTSTIQGQKVPLVQEIELAAKAGYAAMEPWIREIQDYLKAGGELK